MNHTTNFDSTEYRKNGIHFNHEVSKNLSSKAEVTSRITETKQIADIAIVKNYLNMRAHGSSKKFIAVLHALWSRVSSGSIVSDYGLDDRAIGVRSPAGAKGFFL
jgi:hypothetical protein